MNISINNYSQHMTFNAKSPRFTKDYMDRVLLPILEKENSNLDMMVKESDYTYHAILKWFENSLGMTAAKFFKLREEENLKGVLADFYNKGTPIPEIAKIFNRSTGWVQKKLFKFKIRVPRAELSKIQAKRANELLEEGRPIKYIANDVKCSINTVRQWFFNNGTESIVDYRHKNNIKIKRDLSDETFELKQKLEKIFASGKGVSEAAELTGLSKTQVCYWKTKFNLKTKKEEAVERMKILVPTLIPFKISLKEMAKRIGEISTATVRRFIKDEYGKNYIDIRMNK